MYKFSVEISGKIYGCTSNLNDAISFARNLGQNAMVFNGGVLTIKILKL